MTTRETLRTINPLTITFILLAAVLIFFRPFVESRGIDYQVARMGNALLFLLSAAAFFITRRSFTSKNPHVFVRSVYTAFIIKFFVVLIAAFLYFQLTDTINKPALFLCMGLYFIYTFIEVNLLLRILKRNKNNG